MEKHPEGEDPVSKVLVLRRSMGALRRMGSRAPSTGGYVPTGSSLPVGLDVTSTGNLHLHLKVF